MRFRHRHRQRLAPGGLLPPASDLVRGIAITTRLGDRMVLDGVDIAVRKGAILVILGPSGCGKTTLLRHLAGMMPPTLGVVQIEGRDLYRMGPSELDALRRRMGFSFQAGALLNSLSVLDNVALPLREACPWLPAAIIRQTARMKLEMVGLLPAAERSPADLSGGMRKRAAIARAVALDPELMFLDEPSAGLDPVTAAGVDNLILKINKIFGITMVVVTHDIASAFTIADRIVLLLEGKVHATGSRDEVRRWRDSRVQDFIHRALPADEGRLDLVEYLAT